jgi:hypothetical protein
MEIKAPLEIDYEKETIDHAPFQAYREIALETILYLLAKTESQRHRQL